MYAGLVIGEGIRRSPTAGVDLHTEGLVETTLPRRSRSSHGSQDGNAFPEAQLTEEDSNDEPFFDRNLPENRSLADLVDHYNTEHGKNLERVAELMDRIPPSTKTWMYFLGTLEAAQGLDMGLGEFDFDDFTEHKGAQKPNQPDEASNSENPFKWRGPPRIKGCNLNNLRYNPNRWASGQLDNLFFGKPGAGEDAKSSSSSVDDIVARTDREDFERKHAVIGMEGEVMPLTHLGRMMVWKTVNKNLEVPEGEVDAQPELGQSMWGGDRRVIHLATRSHLSWAVERMVEYSKSDHITHAAARDFGIERQTLAVDDELEIVPPAPPVTPEMEGKRVFMPNSALMKSGAMIGGAESDPHTAQSETAVEHGRRDSAVLHALRQLAENPLMISTQRGQKDLMNAASSRRGLVREEAMPSQTSAQNITGRRQSQKQSAPSWQKEQKAGSSTRKPELDEELVRRRREARLQREQAAAERKKKTGSFGLKFLLDS